MGNEKGERLLAKFVSKEDPKYSEQAEPKLKFGGQQSDMDCDMHVFTISSSENSYLLCLPLIFLLRHYCTLPDMCVWLPRQLISIRKLCRLTSTTFGIESFGSMYESHVPDPHSVAHKAEL